jgi:predicted aspartyl protease
MTAEGALLSPNTKAQRHETIMTPLEEAKATNMPTNAAERGFETEVAADEDRAWREGRGSGTGPKGPLLRRTKRRRTERPLCLLCGCPPQKHFPKEVQHRPEELVESRKTEDFRELLALPHMSPSGLANTTFERLRVDGWIGEKPCVVSVDTGASSTIVSPQMAEGLPIRVPASVTYLQSVSGDAVPVLQEALVKLTLGKYHLVSWALVAETTEEFTLGIDVMHAHGVILDLRRNILQLGDEAVPLRPPWMHFLHEEQQ